MTLQSSPGLPPLPVEGIIARSRSRYKGPRPHKDLANLSKPPSLSAERLRRQRNIAPSSCQPRSQNDRGEEKELGAQRPVHETTHGHRHFGNDTLISEAFPAGKRGDSGTAKNRTTLQHEAFSQSRALRGYQNNVPLASHDADAEPHEEAGQDLVPSHKVESSLEHYSILHSSNEKQAAANVETPALPRRGLTQRITGNSNGKRLRQSREELKRMISAPIVIEPPQNVTKPAFDAPLSAVNAGERTVKVKYDQSVTWLPVTPSTTPLDIMRSAASHLAEPIDIDSTVLLESFKQLGLERPLRRYEHVRDVLNSWDSDTQNALIIETSPTGGGESLLDLHSVSRSQPGDTSVYIHYSQRPGHWDKRWVTLRSDGQMLVSKREGGETANICHISDFDIYIPTARQLAKRIRPPRKICYAIKSQQKSSMFLSTANFVHFFSTSDKILAASWYQAVLQWRSWYLVNVMGEGKDGTRGSREVPTKVVSEEVPDPESSVSEGQCRQPEPPPQFKSSITASALINDNTGHVVPFKSPISGHIVTESNADDMPFHRRNQIQTLQFKKYTKDSNIVAPREHGPSSVQGERQEEPEPFAITGLLGRTYTQRQKAQREREKAPNGGQDQPAATPNLNPPKALNRTLSQRSKPKPLIDLSPQYREPPQHVKKGRGVVLEQIPAGGLVAVANTPCDAIPIPPSTTWHRPTSKGGHEPSTGRSKPVRRDHNSGAPSGSRQASTSPGKRDLAFTGGLLASSSRAQGSAMT